MVKFHARWIKKRYQRKKVYRYKHYSLDLPARLNKEIDPHYKKDFQAVDFTFKETAEKETVNITLTRDKTVKQTPNQKN